jgi:hypothetical protein
MMEKIKGARWVPNGKDGLPIYGALIEILAFRKRVRSD